MPVTLQWAFDTNGRAPPEGDAPPAQGSAEVADAPGARVHQVLADTLDNARAEINRITSYWKDAVGPEQDSTMGRSNQAHNDQGAKEREVGDDDDGDDDGEDAEDEEEQE
ncbi:hypothetical protein MCUN1_002604 [Malassezia cuniculi]|uniref:Uncharacterized protein n=1 Tax=Malassezia cuniculi TaxID=948313 RepID=A0AAF0J705_9BASI|nr:hypothetical protein MCUN1_002604 [Malassezia cuniculi]